MTPRLPYLRLGGRGSRVQAASAALRALANPKAFTRDLLPCNKVVPFNEAKYIFDLQCKNPTPVESSTPP